MATRHPLDGSEPSSNVGGRPPALKPEHNAILHDIVTKRTEARLREIADELHNRCRLRVCDATIRRVLRATDHTAQAGARVYVDRTEGAKRYGYTAAHRRKDSSPYSTSLTDAEWDLVSDLFERLPGQRRTPGAS